MNKRVVEIPKMDVKVVGSVQGKDGIVTVDKVFIPVDKEDSIQKIIDQYMGKNLYESDNLYCECEGMLENKVLDNNTGTFMTWEEFKKTHETYICVKEFIDYVKTEIVDDILCLFSSSITQSNDKKRRHMRVTQIFMIFRNKVTIRASSFYEGIVNLTSENGCYLLGDYFNRAKAVWGFHYDCISDDKRKLEQNMMTMWENGIIEITYGKLSCGNMKKFITSTELIPTRKQYALNDKVKPMDSVDINKRKIVFDEVDGVPFMRFFSSTIYHDYALEVFRLFFDKETVLLRNTNFYGFLREKVTCKDLENWSIEDIESIPSSFKHSAKLIKEGDSIRNLISYIENPIIEQMASLNMPKTMKFIIDTAKEKRSKIDTAFEMLYGHLGPKKNLRTFLGMNKHQIEWLKTDEDWECKRMPVIKTVKYILDQDDISSIDNESFDALIGFLYHNLHILPTSLVKSNDFGEFVGLMNCLYSKYKNVKNVVARCEKYKKLFTTSGLYVRRLTDSVVMSMLLGCQLRDFGDDKKEAIDRMMEQHDTFVFALEQRRLDEEEKARGSNSFDKFQGKWQKYEYNGDDFIVVAPKKPMDLVNEGLALHHCVRTFVKAVHEGKTSIFFIRKASEPDVSYFTAEVKNGEIRQIHGLLNCDVTDPNLKRFIMEWITEKKIKKGEWNKVRAV